MMSVIKPTLRYFESGVVGAGPGIWYGVDAPDGDAGDWLRAPVGSIYFYKPNVSVAIAYLKTANNGTGADWVSVTNTEPTAAVFNVLDYGAVGDDETSDTPAFRAAAAAAGGAGAGVVLVPPGTYRLEVGISAETKYIRLPAGCDLRMHGATINAVAATGETGYYVFRISGSTITNVQVSGGTINCDRTSGSLSGENGFGIAIQSQCSNVRISDMTISDAFGDAIIIGGSTAPTDVTIKNCYLSNSRRNNLSITHAARVRVTGCDFVGANGTSPQSGVDVEPDSGYTVEDVIFSNCIASGNAGSGFYIQSGIAGRTAGLAATRRVSLIGCRGYDNAGPGINLSSVDYCTVTGNTCYGSTANSGVAASDVLLCTLTGNLSYGNAANGLYVEGADNCTISSNVFYDNTGSGTYLRGELAGLTKAIQFCAVTGNTTQNNGAMGFRLANVTHSTFTGNRSTYNDEHGFGLDTCAHNQIVGNASAGDGKATDATYSGFNLGASDYNMLHGNMVRHSERYFTGTATAGGAATVTLPANASIYDDWYNDKIVAITSGTGSGQTRTISDYNGTTKVATVSLAWDTQPDATSVVEIRNVNRITKGITFSATSDGNWYIGNDLRYGGGVTDSGTGNVTTAGNLT